MTISFNHVNDTIAILNATTGANSANMTTGVGTLNVSSSFAVTPGVGVNGNYIKNYYTDVNSPTFELYGTFPGINIKYAVGASSFNQSTPIQIWDGASAILSKIGFSVNNGSAGDPKSNTTTGGSFVINTGQAAATTSNVNGDFVVVTRGLARFRVSSNGDSYILGNTTITGSNGITFSDGTTQTTSATLIPQNPQTTNYVLQLTDAGKHIYYTQASNTTLYIPPYNSVAFANGSTIMILSQTTSSANVTISPNTGVSLFLAGNTISASRNVTTYGMASLIQVAANTWFINGTGVA
jgi:hypothetical protein